MKKLILSLLTLGALAGCAKDENLTSVGNTMRVPIRLTAGVFQIETKAPVTSGAFTFAVAGWDGATANYAGNVAWETTGTIADITSADATAISWGVQPYYNIDGGQTTFIQAWYPAGSLASGKVTIPNTVGDQDLILAAGISGTKTSPATALEFTHKTTQLVFQVKKATEVAEAINITGLEIASAGYPTEIDFTSGTAVVNYTSATDLSVPNFVQKEVLATETVIGDPIMIQTPASTKELLLNVKTDKGTFNNVKATIAGAENFKEGTAYTITLTIKLKTVEATGKVAAWLTGTGAGDII